MMRHLSNRPRKTLLTATLVASAALCHAATWQGGPGNWSAGPWDVAPVSGATTDIVFDGGGGAVNNDLGAFTLRSLAFNAGAYSLSGGALTLHGPVQNNSTAAQTIANDITLAAGSRWTLAGNVTYSGAMQSTGSQFGKNGAGELLMTGDNTLFVENPFIPGGSLRLSGPNARLVVKNELVVFNTAQEEKSLTLENGARLEMVYAWGSSFGRHGKFHLSGVGTTWFADNSRINSYDGLQFTITDGAVFTNSFELYLWMNGNHNVTITKGAQIHTELFSFAGNNNTAFVGGAKNGAPALLRVHGKDGVGLGWCAWEGTGPASNNSVIIGTDGLLQTVAVKVGFQGKNNALVVEDGGCVEFIEQGDILLGRNASQTSNGRVEIRGRHPVTQAPSLLDLRGGVVFIESDNPKDDGTSQSTAATAFTNNTFIVAGGAVATNLAVIVGNENWDHGNGDWARHIAREEHSKILIENGGKVFAKWVFLGQQSSANLLRVDGAESLLDLGGNGDLKIGVFRSARDNLMVVNAGSVANTRSVHVGYHNDSGTLVGGNSLRIENSGSLSSNGECTIGSDRWWANASPQTNAFNAVVITGENSSWLQAGDAMRVGYANDANTITYGNSVKVEDGGLLNTPGITVGRGVNAFDNRLILGAGGNIVTPWVNVGADGAVNNAIVFAGGSITATGELNLRQHNGFIVEASHAEFAPSTFGNVIIQPNTWVNPVRTAGGASVRTYILVRGNISGYNNLKLHPSANPALWQLNTSATEISITKKQVGSLLILR